MIDPVDGVTVRVEALIRRLTVDCLRSTGVSSATCRKNPTTLASWKAWCGWPKRSTGR